MLNVQSYLRSGKTVKDLESEFGIKSNPHPDVNDGRVILNYDQIESSKHKLNPIVRECRGLVLDELNNWELVTRGFYRFFNYGESEEDTKSFDWDSAVGTYKEDGSYIVLYNYKGKWHVNTRNSFGHGICNELSGLTWREVFLLSVPQNLFHTINPKRQYVFELCSPYNQVVRQYQYPQSFLLTVFDGENELTYEEICSEYFRKMNVVHAIFNVNNKAGIYNANHVKSFIEEKAKTDPTFEGIVVRDKFNNRLKIKSLKYLELHRAVNNHSLSIETLVKLVACNEHEEFCTYFPSYKNHCDFLLEKINKLCEECDSLWNKYNHIEDKKNFALLVKDSKYSFALFEAFKSKIQPSILLKKNYKKIITLL